MSSPRRSTRSGSASLSQNVRCVRRSAARSCHGRASRKAPRAPTRGPRTRRAGRLAEECRARRARQPRQDDEHQRRRGDDEHDLQPGIGAAGGERDEGEDAEALAQARYQRRGHGVQPEPLAHALLLLLGQRADDGVEEVPPRPHPRRERARARARPAPRGRAPRRTRRGRASPRRPATPGAGTRRSRPRAASVSESTSKVVVADHDRGARGTRDVRGGAPACARATAAGRGSAPRPSRAGRGGRAPPLPRRCAERRARRRARPCERMLRPRAPARGSRLALPRQDRSALLEERVESGARALPAGRGRPEPGRGLAELEELAEVRLVLVGLPLGLRLAALVVRARVVEARS